MLTLIAILVGTVSLDCVSVVSLISALDMINQSVDLMVPCIPATVNYIEQPVSRDFT